MTAHGEIASREKRRGWADIASRLREHADNLRAPLQRPLDTNALWTKHGPRCSPSDDRCG